MGPTLQLCRLFYSLINQMPEIDFNIDDDELQKTLKGILNRLGHIKPAAERMGEIALESITTNFEEGGRPKKWKPLAKKTIQDRQRRGKWPGRILVRQGHAGGLLGSVAYTALNDRVVVHANKVYARIHHFGGKAGRGHKVDIPARPYMMIQDEDWAEMKAALDEYVIRGRSA